MNKREWTDYLIDSLEVDDESGPIANVRLPDPQEPVTPELVRTYFEDNIYPFAERMAVRAYYREKRRLQIELVKLQNWVKDTGQKLVIIFEGRDAAGKGSTIKRFTEHLNPRGSRVVALDKPTLEERGQWYFQRYVDHLPTSGEIVFFDRSWYNRAGVERVMGFCTQEEYEEFLKEAPQVEQMLVRSGIHIVKFYLSVSREEQANRMRERANNPLKQWKLSPIDRIAQERWDDYTQAKLATFEKTDTAEAPWIIVKSEDQMRARLEAMRHVLHRFNYDRKDTAVAHPPNPLLLAPFAILRSWGSP
ncbi:MAG: polyphosphate kinase 2 [Pseudomonadales bacterium]|nr:polyphosphate kinase 2 [Pseudomonadales bacterium]MCP5185865.1 polyphosphate kinase 2 [Pseudomonadales bacterium]